MIPATSPRAGRRLGRASWAGRRGGDDELNLELVSDATMRRGNASVRGRHRGTDVLAVDRRQDGARLTVPLQRTGEVVVAAGQAQRQARAGHRSLARELARLFIHGLLHLQGFDHHRPAERGVMRREEARLMRTVSPWRDELGGTVRREAATQT